jgi:hypothetical protein
MNERTTMLGRVKGKMAEIASDVLIRQAEDGIKVSMIFIISEAKFPIELMKADAE